ncbi:MAG: hypothetical protein K0S22_2384 [Oscillospiraceae bacterium]|jgi:hypothetical protein|nr:hypothetical protein [Oscillospiraceae bacterium]
MKNNIIRLLATMLALSMVMVGCANKTSNSSAENNSSSLSSPDVSEKKRGSYAEEDFLESYDASSATTIVFSNSEATISGNGAKLDGSTVTISDAGTYIVSGELTDGQLLVETTKNDTVHLVLNGVTLKNSSTSPLLIKQAKKVILTLADGSKNSIVDTVNYLFVADEDKPDATLFSKSDLTINGSGALTITANYKNGIASKDNLIITNGDITVTSVDDAIRGKDSVTIADGRFNLTAGGDGIKSNNAEDSAVGCVTIDGGDFIINAENDGIQAEAALIVTNGTFDITCGGGSTVSVMQDNNDVPQNHFQASPPSEMSRKFQEGRMGGGQMPDNTSTETDTISQKGLKGGTNIQITGGVFTMSCVDDTIHSNGDVTISGGTFTLASDDDGLHADGNLLVSGGHIDISQCYEGLEGTTITISEGTVNIVAQDDGINATDASGTKKSFGRPGVANANCYITITGGTIIVNAVGDGFDSNGNLNIEGGLVIINGPTNNGNAAFDYDGSSTITGGTLIAAGSSGMAQAPDGSSTQPVLSVTFSEAQAAGTIVNLTDKNGNLIASFAPEKRFQNMVISSPLLKTGETYKLYSGTGGSEIRINGIAESVDSLGITLCSATLTNIITTISSDGSVITGGMGMGGGMGGKVGRGVMNRSDRKTPQRSK